MSKATVYHIPVCPFSQRLKILLTLKGRLQDINFHVVDITRPRPEWLIQKTRGTSAMPVLATSDGRIIKESLVIMRYLDELFPENSVAQTDPYRHAVEGMLEKLENEFAFQGYSMVMNQSLERRYEFKTSMLNQYEQLNNFLLEHATEGPYLFEEFGWAEAVFTPLFMRFWFLEYYEHFLLPVSEKFNRVSQWIEACISHPAAQQVTKEEIIKLYYDYAKGVGDGGLLPGRRQSSFVFEPDWKNRPWPPRDKYEYSATDEELGLSR
ncbi:MAG: glutathione S-transferase family protein [Gammaproteobacteria bacterium]